jgi:hydrogenase maturation protease
MNAGPQILVACIGNIFLGDDGFGVEVARRLAGRSLPEGVQVIDFGIRGVDLAYALLDHPGLTILVDACPRGGAAGSIYVVEPDLDAAEEAQASPGPLEMHGLNPARVLRMVKSMGGVAGRVLIVGCEPADLGGEAGKMGLSEPVEAAVEPAAGLIEALAVQILDGARVEELLQSR